MNTEAEAGPSDARPPRVRTPGSRAELSDQIEPVHRPTTRRREDDNRAAASANPAPIPIMFHPSEPQERIDSPICKKKKKTKSRRRHATSSQRSNFTDTPRRDADSLRWNADLDNILARIDGHEQRISKHLQSAHDQMVAAVHHMFECLSLRVKENAERERNKVDEIRKKRAIRKAAEYHIRSL